MDTLTMVLMPNVLPVLASVQNVLILLIIALNALLTKIEYLVINVSVILVMFNQIFLVLAKNALIDALVVRLMQNNV